MTPHLEMCSPAGEVTEACVITNRETGKSRGFGFVNFADKESAKATAASMDDQDGDDISAVRTPKRATYRQAAMVPSRVAAMAPSSRVMARALSRHATRASASSRHATPASSSSRFTARASYRNLARALSRVTAMTMAPSSRDAVQAPDAAERVVKFHGKGAVKKLCEGAAQIHDNDDGAVVQGCRPGSWLGAV